MTTKEPTRIPQHIGIILDGNRRWAKKRKMATMMGHHKGKENVVELLDWIREFGIKEVTLYSFSAQNFNRPTDEVKYLMKIFEKAFNEYAHNPDVHKYRVGINIIGRKYLLPERVQRAMNVAIQATKDYQNYRVNFAIGYGGREEIIDAVKNIVKKCASKVLSVEKIDEAEIGRNLYMKSEPDLIIRTGGEQRLSNFLLWQSNYSELFFVDKTWPEFTKKDLSNVLEEFAVRERRFGV